MDSVAFEAELDGGDDAVEFLRIGHDAVEFLLREIAGGFEEP